MMKIKYFVIISREGQIEICPFESKDDAYLFYEIWSVQWSESYICEVIVGPKV